MSDFPLAGAKISLAHKRTMACGLLINGKRCSPHILTLYQSLGSFILDLTNIGTPAPFYPWTIPGGFPALFPAHPPPQSQGGVQPLAGQQQKLRVIPILSGRGWGEVGVQGGGVSVNSAGTDIRKAI